MSIGMYDADLINYGLAPPNLEIMKCSAYYKKKREIVGLSQTIQPEMYSKIIYRKDYEGPFDAQVLTDPKIEYGGLSFTNEEYQPLDESIELSQPDTSIYKKIYDQMPLTKADETIISEWLRAQHLRISLDNKTVWKDFLKPTNIIKGTPFLFIHDPDITKIEGAVDAVKELFSHAGAYTRLWTKYPIKVYSLDELREWIQFPLAHNCEIYIMGMLSNEDWVWIAENVDQTILNRIKYDVTFGVESAQDFIEKRMRNVFRQMVFLRSHLKYLTLIYSASILLDPQWIVVFSLWNAYFSSTKTIPKDAYDIVMEKDCFFRFIKKINERDRRFTVVKNSVEEMREMFKFVHDINYEVFADFYNCHNVKYEGGEFV